MAEVNQLLRTARQATASLASPGFALSRSELADLLNAASLLVSQSALDALTARVSSGRGTSGKDAA